MDIMKRTNERGFKTLCLHPNNVFKEINQTNDKFKAVRTCYITPKLVQLWQPKAPNCATRLSWDQIICDKCTRTQKKVPPLVSYICNRVKNEM